MKPLLACLLLVLLASCASKENMPPDPAQIRADERAREDFAKQLPKPADR